MSCTKPCPLEQSCQHHSSPGVILDEEIVCRGGFYPMHYKKGTAKKSVIRRGDLVDGVLSFWRAGPQGTGAGIDNAIAKIRQNTPNLQELEQVFCPSANAIRQIEIPQMGRVMCVVDDCKTDDNGGYDADHCGVKLCDLYREDGKQDEIYTEARNQLYLVLISSARQAA